ncbi:MAG: chorismate synthase [Chlamydiae bacterium]|nr:chorismate synthase [Chlamydiota bacterium]MBI3276923.1 chorismate synthase [Chlamydiota bacterium]
MSGNIFGHLFRITTWGESHGGGVGVVIDGCPPRIPLDLEDIQYELDRRRPGQSKITTPRQEEDRVQILSGVFEGLTLGTPISMMVWNKDTRPEDYSTFKDTFRPSHADYTYQQKYGIRNWQGGGRASARETIGRVAAGAIAKKILKEQCGITLLAYVKQIHQLSCEIDLGTLNHEQIESNIVRCPDSTVAKKMIHLIEETGREGDSLGGVIEAVAKNIPVGLGDPVFDKLEADLAKAVMSLPATKGFEIGSGFAGSRMTGSQHNDPFYIEQGKIRTKTNRSGGVQGGISNGEDIVIRVAFKPTATIKQIQESVNIKGESTQLSAPGRHDPCVLPRAVPMVEAMMALVLVDHYLRQKAQCG